MNILGRWRIVRMDLWEQLDVDLVAPGFIEFEKDGLGSLSFVAVQGHIDWIEASREGMLGAEFSWEGFDDGDPVGGRGWAALDDDDSIRGHVYFHLGDDSSFHAVSEAIKPSP